MKKLLLFMTLVLLSSFVYAQKIDKNYYDQFTGKRVMYTTLEKFNWKYKNPRIGGKMQVRFILNDDFQYMVLHWYSKNYLDVAANAKIQFKLDNGHTITLNNESLVTATKGGTSLSKNDVGVVMNCLGDVSKFATAIVTAVRIYTSEGYYDFEIEPKDGAKLHKMYMLFSREVYIGA